MNRGQPGAASHIGACRERIFQKLLEEDNERAVREVQRLTDAEPLVVERRENVGDTARFSDIRMQLK